MAGDIEEFLRRAAQRRAQQQQPQRPPSQRPAPPARPVAEPEIIEAVEVVGESTLHPGSVGDHVSDHMRDHVFDERLAHLGEEVDQADDVMEAHLHEYFEHDLGALGPRTSRAEDSILDDDSPAAPPATSPAADFLSLLRSPASVRQAIILAEILDRPEQRW